MALQSIGTFQAKAQLSKLLDRVIGGESITITRHGMPVAKLVPFDLRDRDAARQAVEEWKRLRVGNRLGKGLSIKDLRGQGRR